VVQTRDFAQKGFFVLKNKRLFDGMCKSSISIFSLANVRNILDWQRVLGDLFVQVAQLLTNSIKLHIFAAIKIFIL